jgi:putative oxidoreductase
MDLNTSTRPWVDVGLLLARLGLGASFAIDHGWGKLYGGPDAWMRLGGAMEAFGITFLPVVWGFLAAFAEFFGAILLAVGLFFRPAAFMLAFTMFVAAFLHMFVRADGGYGHALDAMIMFLALMITGPGRLAVRQFISPLRDSLLG